MLSTLREKLSTLPPAVSYGACVILILGAAVIIFIESRPRPLEMGRPPDPNAYFKCTNPQCGHVVQGPMQTLIANGQISTEWLKNPQDRGARCPKCGQNTLQMARKCPHCGCIFSAGLDTCPSCKKSPFDE